MSTGGASVTGRQTTSSLAKAAATEPGMMLTPCPAATNATVSSRFPITGPAGTRLPSGRGWQMAASCQLLEAPRWRSIGSPRR